MFTDNNSHSNRIVYTPSPFAKESLLYVQEIGSLSAPGPQRSSRQGLSSFLFFLVDSGSGSIRYNNHIYNLNPGDGIFIDCSKNYMHLTDKNPWSLKWVHFCGWHMPAIYDKYLELGGQPAFHLKDAAFFSKVLKDLFWLAGSDDTLKELKINEGLSSLINLIMDSGITTESVDIVNDLSGHTFSLHEVKTYLEQNWAKRISLDELADEFYISKYYLTRLFKSRYGVSILNFLTELRITHAKQKLRFTGGSIESISHECGFDDQNYFARTFKKVEGITPSEYRRKWVH